MRLTAVAFATLVIGCSGSSTPTAPSSSSVSPIVPATPTAPTTGPTTPATPTFTGLVTNTVTGASIQDYTATIAGGRLLIAAPGYVTRDTRAGATTVDLIPERGFELEFYRQLARGTLTHDPQPLFVLRQSPSFFMQVEGDNGLPAQLAVEVERIARRVVPEMTGGLLQVARFETGPQSRPPQNGWIMVERRDAPAEICGQALVGSLAGSIWLDGSAKCNWSAVIAHEIGHALGFWHVDVPGSLMFPVDRESNIADAPTDRERHHMQIAYKRVRGNLDIDVDP
jgi:hypothetical protein